MMNWELSNKNDFLIPKTTNDPLAVKKLILPSNDGLLIIPENEINFVRSDNIYAYIHNGKEKYFTTSALKEIESLLDPNLFFRCHRSYIVNLNSIIKIVKHQNCYLILSNGSEIPVSRNKKKDLIDLVVQAENHVTLD